MSLTKFGKFSVVISSAIFPAPPEAPIKWVSCLLSLNHQALRLCSQLSVSVCFSLLLWLGDVYRSVSEFTTVPLISHRLVSLSSEVLFWLLCCPGLSVSFFLKRIVISLLRFTIVSFLPRGFLFVLWHLRQITSSGNSATGVTVMLVSVDCHLSWSWAPWDAYCSLDSGHHIVRPASSLTFFGQAATLLRWESTPGPCRQWGGS